MKRLSLLIGTVCIFFLLPALAHADAVDDWYAAVCGDNGLWFKRIAYAGMTIGGASLLSNSKTLLNIPVVGPVLQFLAVNWRPILEAWSNTATKAPPAAKNLAVLLAIGLTLALTACTGQLTGNPAADVPAVLQTIQPVESALACALQAQANLCVPTAAALAKTDVVAGCMVTSAIAGTFCNGLHAGATLPTPVAVVGTTAMSTPTGTVVLPVPALPKP